VAAVYLDDVRLDCLAIDPGRWRGHRHPGVQSREGAFVLGDHGLGSLTGRHVAVVDDAGEWFRAVVTRSLTGGRYDFASVGGPLP
jgi:hypothetical protein